MVLAVVLVVALGSAVGLMAFAEDAAATAQTRIYNENFDRMLDNGSGDGATPAYRAVSWTAGQCADVTNPIFKIGSPKFSAGFDEMQIVLRSPDESVKLADLKIGFRVSDSDAIATENSYVLTDTKIADAIILSDEATDIGAEWVAMSIDLTQANFDDDKVIDTTATDALLAIHLFAADNTKAGKLDIQKVSVFKNSTENVIDNFDDVRTEWWKDSEKDTFVDVAKYYAITDSKQIVSDAEIANNLDEAYSAIVLKIAGSGAVTVAPVGSDGAVGTAVAWADLTDLNGTGVAALTEDYTNAVISLKSLGAKAIKGVQIAVTGGTVNVAQAFFTNMEARDPEKYFPALDVDSIAYMSQFNFEYAAAGEDYEKGVADAAPFGLEYMLAYSAKNNVVTNGHLVMDAKGDDYTNFKVRSKVASEGRKYLVLKYKLEGGATIENLRFAVIKTDGDSTSAIVNAGQMSAAFGLPSTSALNPYQASKDYKYFVVDMEMTFGETYVSGINAYVSGAGQILIDEIYYAHPKVAETVVFDNILESPVEITVGDGSGYDAGTAIDFDGNAHDGLIISMHGSEGYDLDTVRLAIGNATVWFNPEQASKALDIYGREMPALAETNQDYYIDFAASGITSIGWAMWIHRDKVEGGATLTIDSVKYVDYVRPQVEYGENLIESEISVTATAANLGYTELTRVDTTAFGNADFIKMTISGDVTGLRLGMGSGTYWFADNDEGRLRNSAGNLFDLAETGERTLIIDLKQTGAAGNLGLIVFHHTFQQVGDVITLKSLSLGRYASTDVASDELVAEPITHDAAAGYYYFGYIPANSAYAPSTLTLKVTGDLTKVRLGFEGTDKTLWFAENAEGSLYDVDGKLFDLTETGERTLVIDLAKSGLYYPLNGIHVHNEDNALTISSAIYGSRPVGYEDVVLPTNDDTKPVITASVPTTGTVGTEITLAATATDNYSDDVTISYAVALGTTPVTVANNKFTPSEAGTYAVTITATDAAGNVATQTVSIAVAAAGEPEPTPTEPTEPTGLGAGAIVGIVLACLAVVAVVVVVVVLKRKKASK